MRVSCTWVVIYLFTTPQLRYNGNHKPILVHSHVHNSLPAGPVLGQMNSVHMHSSYLCMTRLNIILQPTPWSFKIYLSLRFSKVLYTCFTFPMHSKCTTHVILPNPIILTLNDSDHEAPLDTVINMLRPPCISSSIPKSTLSSDYPVL